MKKTICYIAIFCLISILLYKTYSAQAIGVSAKCAILVEAQNGTALFEQNADLKVPMASTTKIMTAIVAIEMLNLENFTTVDISKIFVEGSSMYLQDLEVISIRELLYGLLLRSGNDAANALAIECAGSIDNFANLMNKKAEQLGLKNSHFCNPSGLDNKDHYTTARDFAILTVYALNNPTFSEIVSTKNITFPATNKNTGRVMTNANKLLWQYDGAAGVKTGFTSSAGRCLVSTAVRDGVRLVAITFRASNDWNDHKEMLNYGFTRAKKYIPETKLNQSEILINVIGGESDKLLVFPEVYNGLIVIDQESTRVIAELEVPEFVYAPIYKNQKIGRIVYKIDGKYKDESNLLASQDILLKNINEKKDKETSYARKIFANLTQLHKKF